MSTLTSDHVDDTRRRGVFRDGEGRIAVGWRVAAYVVIMYLAGFLVQFTVFSTLQQLVGFTTPQQLHVVAFWPYLVIVAGVGLLITMWFRRHLDRRPFREIGLTTADPRRATLQLVLGLLGAAAMVAGILAVNIAAGFLVVTAPAWEARPAAAVVGLSLAGLGLGLSTGFFEELQFRGYVLANLGERLPLWAAGLILSAIFTPIHLLINPGLVALLPVLVMSMIFVALRAASGSLWLPIGFHAGYNWAYNQAFPDLGLPSLVEGTDTRLSSPLGWAVDLTVVSVVFVAVSIAGRHRIRWREPIGPGPGSSSGTPHIRPPPPPPPPSRSER